MSKTTAAWSTARILEILEMKNAMRAMGGKPCPVAVRVVARLKAV